MSVLELDGFNMIEPDQPITPLIKEVSAGWEVTNGPLKDNVFSSHRQAAEACQEHQSQAYHEKRYDVKFL